MRVLGIDPGISGAAAVLDMNPGRRPDLVDIIDLPIIGDDAKTRIDAAQLMRWIIMRKPEVAFVERASAMPSIPGADGMRRAMGVASTFKYGRSVGAIEAAIACAGVPWETVEAGQWKKAENLPGKDKEPARLRATQLFPASSLFGRKKDHQRAEACLIAKFGWEKQNGIITRTPRVHSRPERSETEEKQGVLSWSWRKGPRAAARAGEK